MAEIQVGKVMLTFKGEYDSTKSYTRLDAVTYQGSSYVCLSDTTSVPPSESWQLLADKGADGQPGKDGQPGSPGVTPHIDATTGNWFIGTTNTGVKAQGPAGQNGIPGTPGADGKTSYFHIAYANSADGKDGFYVGGGTNLLTGTGDHTVTGTVTGTGSSISGYLSNETTDDLLTLFKGLEGQTVTVSVDYEYSGFVAGIGNNRIGWEIGLIGDTETYFGPWYYPTNDSGSGRMSSTFVVPKNITSIEESMGYIQFPGSGALSHLKLEKGSVATPWSPAPSELRPLYMGTYTDFTQADSLDPTAYSWSRIKGDKGDTGANTVTTITLGTLADLANNQGSYHYEIDFIPSDSPTHDGGLLDVVVGANYAKQVFTSTANSDVYVRTRKQGVWSAWRQVTLWN